MYCCNLTRWVSGHHEFWTLKQERYVFALQTLQVFGTETTIKKRPWTHSSIEDPSHLHSHVHDVIHDKMYQAVPLHFCILRVVKKVGGEKPWEWCSFMQLKWPWITSHMLKNVTGKHNPDPPCSLPPPPPPPPLHQPYLPYNCQCDNPGLKPFRCSYWHWNDKIRWSLINV